MVCQGHQRRKSRHLFSRTIPDLKSPSVIPVEIESNEAPEIPVENDLPEDAVENLIEPNPESPEPEAVDTTLEVAEISGEEAEWDPLATEEIEVEEVLEDLTTDSGSLNSEQPAAKSQEEEITEETTEITTETASEAEPDIEFISEETEAIDPVAESEPEEDAIDPRAESEPEEDAIDPVDESKLEEDAIVAEADETDADIESTEVTDEDPEDEKDEDAEDTLVDIPLLLSDVVGGLGTVTDPSGQLSVIWKFDGGAYEGQVGVVSTTGLENYDLNSIEFMQEAIRRALDNIVVDDTIEGSEITGDMGDGDSNHGAFAGEKIIQLSVGEQFFFVVIPNGTFTNVLANLEAGEVPTGSLRPLFSLTVANPDSMNHFVQVVDLTGKGSTFALEDISNDQKSDWDLNDIIITVKGADLDAPTVGDLIDAGVMNQEPWWREGEVWKTIVESVVDTIAEEYDFPKEDQPLIGFIDTHLTQGNPDIDYSRIIFGKDWIENDSNPTVVAGEGTHADHILGIVAATQDNGLGIDGINDDAPLWVSSAVESGKWADALVEFVDAAIASNQPNAIINLSIDLTQVNPDGSVTTRYEFTPQERAAIEYARQSGVLIVAASGNDGGVMSVLGQASQEFDNIITVGAADGMARAAYSSYGYGLDIVAPGGTVENPVLSTSGEGVGSMAGTSVATAKVTGAASQVWAANPELSYRQVIEILKKTATDLNTPGWDAETGTGLLDMAAAVGLAKVTQGQPYDVLATIIPNTWSGEGKVTPLERASQTPENFRLRVWPDLGVNLRNSPDINDRSPYSIPKNTWLDFDAWTWGNINIDPITYGQDALYYRTWYNGQAYWVPSIWIDGYPPSNPPLLPPVQQQPQPQPQPQPTTNNTLYLSTSGGQILVVNTATGQQSQIYQGIAFTDLAVSSDNRLFGCTFDSLYEINPTNGQAKIIGNFGGKSINSLTFSPDGRLYGADDTNGNLYQISLQTAQASQIGSLGGPSSGDMVFNGNEILATVGSPFSSSDRLVAVNLSNGNTRIIGDLGYRKVYGLAQVNGQLTAYTSTGQKLSVNPQNASTSVVGSVSSNGEVWGAAINPSNNSTQIGQPPSPPTSITIGGYTISGNFYPVFKNYQGTLGNPTSGVINYSSGVTYQTFQNGSIVSSNNGTFPLYGAIRQTYLNNGGLNGWLGAPTSPEIGQGNGVIKQTFKGGYIIWNGRTATAYRTGTSTSITPSPSPTPTNGDIRWVNFSGIVGPSNGVNLRTSPRFSDRSSRNEPYGKTLEFDAWTYGEVGTDIWTGQSDARWFRIKGTNLWVPSAYINGNPPNSSPMPGGGSITSGNQGSAGNNSNPVNPNPGSGNSSNNGSGVTTGGSTTIISPGQMISTINFDLRNQSIWNGGQGSSIGGSISNKLNPDWSFDLAKVSLEAGYNFSAFASAGTFGINIPTIFDINWQPTQDKKSLAVNFSSRLSSGLGLETLLGLDLSAKLNLGAKLETTFPILPNVSIEFEASEEISLQKAMKDFGSPFVLDLSLQAKKKNGEINNNIEVDDVAFQAIDFVNTLMLFPKTRPAAKALKEVGVGASLGLNVQQKSKFNVTGFEIDYDNQKNGNELILPFNGTGTLNIPIPSWLQKGQEFKFTPTIKPITSFQSFFNLGGKLETSLEPTELADKLPIPSWLKDNVINNLPDISLKNSVTTPYWNVWQGKTFDPFSFTSAYKSNEISIKLS